MNQCRMQGLSVRDAAGDRDSGLRTAWFVLAVVVIAGLLLLAGVALADALVRAPDSAAALVSRKAKDAKSPLVVFPTPGTLVAACWRGDLPAVTRLLAQGVSPYRENGLSPLEAALWCPDALELIVKGNHLGWGVPAGLLHQASQCPGRTTEILVAAGARVDERRPVYMEEPLSGAYQVVNGCQIPVGGPPFRQTTPLHEAAYHQNVEVVMVLLAHGANLAALDRDGNTPLHWAASGGSPPVVRVLLGLGADVTVRNAAGESPADSARGLAKAIPDGAWAHLYPDGIYRVHTPSGRGVPTEEYARGRRYFARVAEMLDASARVTSDPKSPNRPGPQ